MPVEDMRGHLERLARAPSLLVACDYDGTLSPIVADPAAAQPIRESVIALRELAALPSTHVAVISGRALTPLAQMLGDPPLIHLIGSHGSEFEPGFASSLSASASALRDRILEAMRREAQGHEGFRVEEKPASVAFHFRNVPPVQADRAVRSLLDIAGKWDGVFIKHGKMVLEFAVVPTDKGTALQRVRQRTGAAAALFVGDDVTDEDAFAMLAGPDLGVKVGAGPSRAAERAQDPDEVSRILAFLYEERAAWIAGGAAVPIEQHALLSDQRTAALVTPDGRITWMCLPRLDSPAMFAELIGGAEAGCFAITSATEAGAIEQRYLGESMVLRTCWRSFTVTDFFDASRGRIRQRAGRSDLVRIVEGKGPVRIEFAPRLDFGREPTVIQVREGGLTIANTNDPIVLRSPGVQWRIEHRGNHHSAIAEIELTPASPVVLTLCYGSGSLRPDALSPNERQIATERMWSSWASRLSMPHAATEMVRRSALTLKALCHGPSGAIAAAPTTSLPEDIGGVRNWDYRFCWLRDAAMSAAALVKLGSDEEAMHFLDWMLSLLAQRSPERLQPLYTLTGEPLGSEAEIGELSGYAGSRPVRIGNAAARQVQLDVFGPIMELISLLIERDAPLSSEHWRLVDDIVGAVGRRWREPDHGIWEIRSLPRHHVHSKVMCWLAVDRGVRIAERFHDRRHGDWIALRDAIADDVLKQGYKPHAQAFTAAYDGDDLDAAALWIGLSGLIGSDDPRFAGTVRAVETHLREGPVVYRYRTTDDGLPGTEGGFHICTSWLIDAYLLQGRIGHAQKLFDELIALAGPTGLLPEQYDPHARRHLGNHPQAYSHLGLIENALRLTLARNPSAVAED